MFSVMVRLYRCAAIRLGRRWGGVIAVVLAGAWQRIRTLLSKLAGTARSKSGGGLPAVRQQFLDPAVQLSGQPGKNVLQVVEGVVPVEFGRLHQARDDRSTLARQFAAYEQPVRSFMRLCS